MYIVLSTTAISDMSEPFINTWMLVISYPSFAFIIVLYDCRSCDSVILLVEVQLGSVYDILTPFSTTPVIDMFPVT